MHQVVVVGAGPIGSYTAALLASKGLEVLILEEHSSIGEPVHCTGIIGCQAFEEYDLSKEAIVSSISEISMVSPSGQRITYKREKPLAHTVCRTRYDRYIADKATRSGATLKLGVRVNALEQDEKGVTLYCRGSEPIRAQICILATGSLSNIPSKMGLGKPQQFMLAGQIEAFLDPIEHTEVFINQEFAPGFFAWAVPVGKDGHCRIGLCSPNQSSAYLKKFLDSLAKIKKIDLQGKKPAFSRIPIGMCKRSYHKRIVAVGDAASQVKPTTGGGLYYGLHCAKALADTLNQGVFQKKWNPDFFSIYEKKWKKRLGRELRSGYFFKELVALSDNQKLDRIIQELKKDSMYHTIFPHADFDYHSRMILKMLSNPFLSYLFLSSFKDWVFSKFFPPPEHQKKCLALL